jgi:hypothetical protein
MYFRNFNCTIIIYNINSLVVIDELAEDSQSGAFHSQIGLKLKNFKPFVFVIVRVFEVKCDKSQQFVYGELRVIVYLTCKGSNIKKCRLWRTCVQFFAKILKRETFVSFADSAKVLHDIQNARQITEKA